MEQLEEESSQLEERCQRVNFALEEQDAKIYTEKLHTRRLQFLTRRLTTFTRADEIELSSLRSGLRRHAADAKALRLKLMNELPKVVRPKPDDGRLAQLRQTQSVLTLPWLVDGRRED